MKKAAGLRADVDRQVKEARKKLYASGSSAESKGEGMSEDRPLTADEEVEQSVSKSMPDPSAKKPAAEKAKASKAKGKGKGK